MQDPGLEPQPSNKILRFSSLVAQGIKLGASLTLAEHLSPERQKQRQLFCRCSWWLSAEALAIIWDNKLVGDDNRDKVFWRDVSGDTGSRDLKNPEQGHSGPDEGAMMEGPGRG